MEMHIVSFNKNRKSVGQLAGTVIAILFKENQDNDDLSFADHFFRKIIGTDEVAQFESEFADHLNFKKRFVFMGSLTTPPYSEHVLWNVLEQVIPV